MPRSFAHRLTSSTPAIIALAIAACAEPTAPVNSPRSISPNASSVADKSESENGNGNDNNDDNSNREMFYVRGYQPDNAARRNSGGGSASMVYHGGPVLQAGTKVAAVYWATSPIYVNAPTPGTHGAGSNDGSLIGTFLRNFGGSPYFNINTSYTDGSGKKIVNSVSYTQYWANNTSAPTGSQTVSDAQMVSMLQSGFNSGALTYDASTLYAIFTPGKVNLGGGFGTQYCAYHAWATVTIGGVSRTVLYAAMPYDNAFPSGCTSGFKPANGSLDPGADYEVNTLAHETEETTTDPNGNAWFDRRGQENADKCAWTWGTTYTTSAAGTANMKLGGTDFLIQRNWLNTSSNAGCALSF